MNTDVEMFDATPGVEEDDRQPIRHFVVAVDFGTTFSSVAYAAYTHEHQREYLDLSNIDTIDQYPDWTHSNNPIYDVPTEIWYPNPGHREDGTNSFIAQEQTVDSSSDEDQEEEEEEDEDEEEEAESESDTDSKHTASRGGAPPVVSMDSGITPCLYWGYAVQRQVQIAQAFDNSKRIPRFKLLLHDGPEAQRARSQLEGTFAVLKKAGLVKFHTDLIAHYLEHLFKHTRLRLIEEGYTNDSRVEFVLCVPAIWNARACRQMHTAMSQAIERSGFGNLQNKSIDNLFIVSEPEAAATAAVQNGKVQFQVGETVLILDAGGATVDAATYTVAETLPLRFKTEEVELGGACCGSSYINERFEDLLVQRLSDEHYLIKDGEDMSRVIDRLVVLFERRDKLALDHMFANHLEDYWLIVDGLKKKNKKHFQAGRMRLSKKEIKRLFLPSAEGVAEIMKGQIDAACRKRRPCHVKKVVLMGGYGQSKSLAAHLREVLSDDPRYRGIELRCPKLMPMAVAQGAVLRALRKEEGPDRILQSSYGFLRSEPYMQEKEYEEAHRQQKPWRDPVDGLKYIENAICWEIQKGTTIAAETRVERQVEYTFAIRKSKLECRETLVVSDRYPEQETGHIENGAVREIQPRQSHYRYNHPKNADAEVVGDIVFDVSHLKNTDMVKKMPPQARGMFPYWKVWAKLTVIVDGRNLRYEARLRDESGEAEARVVGQVSLAPALKPGTE